MHIFGFKLFVYITPPPPDENYGHFTCFTHYYTFQLDVYCLYSCCILFSVAHRTRKVNFERFISEKSF